MQPDSAPLWLYTLIPAHMLTHRVGKQVAFFSDESFLKWKISKRANLMKQKEVQGEGSLILAAPKQGWVL